MLLYLVRHARAEEPAPGRPDAERALTEDGFKRFNAACRGLVKAIAPVPELWLVSPFKRAQQTAELLRKALRYDGRMETAAELVPEADPERALQLLLVKKRVDSAIMIGHEPHLGVLFGWLVTGNAEMAIPLKRGQVVCVEFTAAHALPARLIFALAQRTAAAMG